MTTARTLRSVKSACKDSQVRPAKAVPAPECGFSSVRPPATAPGLARDRAQPSRGAPLVYMPLAAFGVYDGEVRAVRPDGRVDIALYRYGRNRYSSDRAAGGVELSRIEIVETRETMRPGTCLLIDPNVDAPS